MRDKLSKVERDKLRNRIDEILKILEQRKKKYVTTRISQPHPTNFFNNRSFRHPSPYGEGMQSLRIEQ